MSIWTHVIGSIRFDGLPSVTPEPVLGNPCTFDSSEEDWDKCDIPCGSEGSLEYTYHRNPDETCMTMGTATFFGDLRDYEDEQEVINYFNRIITGHVIRQGVFSVWVEGREKRTFVYDDGKGKFVECFEEMEAKEVEE